MLVAALGVLVACHSVLGYPRPGPGPVANPGPAPNPNPGPVANPGPNPQPYGGYYGGGHGYGCGEEIIHAPVCPPVLNTVDVYDIATLGVIPAPAIEYIYPAVGYEAFGLGDCHGGYGHGYGGHGGYGHGY